MDIVRSAYSYEHWLRSELGRDFVAEDLGDKHKKMDKNPLEFLRATYWRWAETIFTVCPKLRKSPAVLAVGDIHIENFGTWRDAEGRLVWGVNDFDEAAKMPYALDLLRLATSAALVGVKGLTIERICSALLAGYRDGLLLPSATVLDRDNMWLRRLFEVSERERAAFWKKFDPKSATAKVEKRARRLAKQRGKKAKAPTPSKRHVAALKSARPDRDTELTLWPRSAGTGSLGRSRWVGYGVWHDAPLIRESKAMVPSAWLLAHKQKSRKLRCVEIATGRYRSPDPWYRLRKRILVRRLSPNNRKLEVDQVPDAATLINAKLLHAMGRELAAIHLGVTDRRAAIRRDLRRLGPSWLVTLTRDTTKFVRDEYAVWTQRDALASKTAP